MSNDIVTRLTECAEIIRMAKIADPLLVDMRDLFLGIIKTEIETLQAQVAAGDRLRGTIAQPLSTCVLPEGEFHALVYGRFRWWPQPTPSEKNPSPIWSKVNWWKAMWYPHRGEAKHSGSWGIYGGHVSSCPGDAELTYWLPIPAIPIDASKVK